VRRAIPHDERPQFRVVFRHPNRWYVQERSGEQGTRTIDPWFDISPNMGSQEDALALMYQRYPKKPKAA